MLRLVGEGPGARPGAGGGTLQVVDYLPGVAGSGDLEPGTKTITVTSQPATPDYSTTLTLPSPPQDMSVLRLCLRVRIYIDISDTFAYYAVYLNGAQLFSSQSSYQQTGDWTGAGDVLPPDIVLGSPDQVDIYLWRHGVYGTGFTVSAWSASWGWDRPRSAAR